MLVTTAMRTACMTGTVVVPACVLNVVQRANQRAARP